MARHKSMLLLCILWILLGTISALNDEGHALQDFRYRLRNGTVLNWNSSHSTPCRWSGVACKHAHVVSINLSGKQLQGSLTLDVTRLIHLQVLNLSSNAFHGAIPSFWRSSASMRILDLSNNELSGEIPKELSRFSILFEGNDKLCGHPTGRQCGSSIRSLTETSVEAAVNGDGEKEKLDVGLVVGVCFAAFVFSKLLLFLLWYYWWRKKMQGHCEVKLSGGRMIMFQQTGHVTPLAKSVLRKAEKLKPQDIIGRGGYGTVYKLVMDDMSTFAVKKLINGGGERDQGFEAELQAMADVRHRNLVALRGYYSAHQINLLVFDLMANGNLESVLHDYAARNAEPLNWEQRMMIALGVARGLSYLHYDCIPHIIHRDIKCSNILLDDNMEAHIADFGLAKFLGPQETHMTTLAAGTLGYLPPEYLETGKISEKGDVYSYGIVLLELLTGKRPCNDDFKHHDFNIVQWAIALIARNRPEDIFDEHILGTAPDEDLLTALGIAMNCTNEVPKARPSTQHNVKMLQKLCGEDDDVLYCAASAISHPYRASQDTGMVYPCADDTV